MVAHFTQMSDEIEVLTVICDRNIFSVVYRPQGETRLPLFHFLILFLG